MRNRPWLLLTVVLAGACVGDPPAEAPPTTSIVGATIVATPAPTATATPTATAAPTPNPIAYVRVAFFGVNCRGGGAPNGAERRLPVGCSGDVTATPKREDGRDVPAEIHGPDITWELVHGERLLSLYDVPDQPFNKHLIGRIPGPFMLCATVKNVMGCLTGEVTR